MTDEVAVPAEPAVEPVATTEPGAVAPVPETVPTPGETPPEKPRGGFQRRIDRLTREKYELADQVRDLQSRIQAPAASAEPKQEDFDDLRAYNAALVKHYARQEAQEALKREREAASAAQEEASSRALFDIWEDRKEAAADKIADFYDTIAQSTAPMTAAMGRAIMESEKGPEIVYHLAKNPTEAERISKLSPARQAAEIGKLELKVSEPPKPRPTSAPPPIEPVSGGVTAADNGPSDKDDVSTWMRKERERVKKLAS